MARYCLVYLDNRDTQVHPEVLYHRVLPEAPAGRDSPSVLLVRVGQGNQDIPGGLFRRLNPAVLWVRIHLEVPAVLVVQAGRAVWADRADQGDSNKVSKTVLVVWADSKVNKVVLFHHQYLMVE